MQILRRARWTIINEDVKRDEEKEWTYAEEQGELVIDYVIRDEKTREKIRSMIVEEKMESDHYSIIINIEGK